MELETPWAPLAPELYALADRLRDSTARLVDSPIDDPALIDAIAADLSALDGLADTAERQARLDHADPSDEVLTLNVAPGPHGDPSASDIAAERRNRDRRVHERRASYGGSGSSSEPLAVPHVDDTVIDRMVDEFACVDPVIAVIDAFLDDANDRRDAVTEGIKGDQVSHAIRACHTLKSTAALLGSGRLSTLCRTMERLLSEGKSVDDALVSQFHVAFDGTLNELRCVRRRLEQS